MASEGAKPVSSEESPGPGRDPRELPAEGVFVRRGFLSPFAMVKVLGALDRLSASWASSEDLGLLGRGQTGQIRVTGIAAQAQMDEIRQTVAPPVLHWARSCGFRNLAAPQLQLFPVRMVGDAQTPAFQEPHTDSHATQAGPPICTSVFYAKTQNISGGDFAVARQGDRGLADPVLVRPTANSIVTIAGDRVHWVRPLFAGERLSVVINFY
jgi:hypothetical protein